MAKKLEPTVLTVHDIIEVLDPQDKKAYWLNKYLYSGITRATKLIAVSNYTAKAVSDYYGVDQNLIEVIYNGVDDFYKIDGFEQTVGYQALKAEYKIPSDSQIVLSVGSDHPRKNVVGAARVLAEVMKKNKKVFWLKVGEPGILGGREILLSEIDKLGIRESVRFVGNVDLNRLNEIYNLADVLIFPSRFEGFGLPPLQAMAAGTPVVSSKATSLPEVVGDNGQYGDEAAATFEPDDEEGMAQAVEEFLQNEEKVRQYRERGLERVKLFNWPDKVEAVRRVYEGIWS
jgi:glycosyltransferase involved in cell wall biosynthesis